VSEKIVTMTRVFSAPREEVFAAWTQAKHLARWFGPTDFTVPSCEPSAEAAAMLSGMQKGWSQTVDRLGALLNPHFTPKR
jgi:uncharacterized protein YndB with AHSA1/START domain